MTLPTTIDLPSIEDNQNSNDRDKYLKDLVKELQGMYESLTENINGFIRNDTEVDQAKWTPTLNGTVAGTFTYTTQVGWSVRQGIYTELFFDIEWSSTTASGNIYLELPYKVTKSSGKPFVGAVQYTLALAATYPVVVINAIPDTYRGEFWICGPTVTTIQKAILNTGHLIGSIRYIGLEDE